MEAYSSLLLIENSLHALLMGGFELLLEAFVFILQRGDSLKGKI